MATWSKEVFAKNLKYYMDCKRINQKELADIVGVSAPTVNDWLKSKKYPRIDKIEIIADYFRILKSDLIEEKSDEHMALQANNDIISDIIIRMRTDMDFLSVVTTLNSLDKEKLSSVQQMLCAFTK